MKKFIKNITNFLIAALIFLPIIYVATFVNPWSPLNLKRNADYAHEKIVALQKHSNFLEKRIKALEDKVK